MHFLRTCGRLATLALLTFVVAIRSVSPQPSQPPTDRQALVGELAVANRILANEGVLDGYGHVSVRSPSNPNHYLLARSRAPALVEAGDIVEYDLDSVPVSGGGTGYIERFIHGEIYRTRPDVRSIVHCHCPDVIPFAATAVPLRPLYHMASFIGAGVPVFEIRQVAGVSDLLIRTPELGRALASTLGDKAAALMRGHGAVVAAASLHLAVAEVYYLNLNARLQLQAVQLGGDRVVYLDPQEAKLAAQDYERSWDFWKSRLPRP
ncbi:MAG TPA: class II aldolase/adducin family protein [Vicinamibacterales bacterium]|nr:class II aldolase/adducin family protein [Vicinamibacterales bacterium]